MPGPRDVKGAVAPTLGVVLAWPYRVVLAGLYRANVRPWQLTLLSLAANVVVGWLLLTGRRLLPGLLLAPAGVLDVYDGAIARLQGTASRAGGFLDSALDRVSDVIVFGCLFWSLAGQGNDAAAGLALAALVLSFMVSQVRAEAEALHVPLTEGLVQRFERYVALMIGLTAPGALIPMLALLTALGAATAVQRAGSAWQRLAASPA
jgi:CDP-diacylglycerol--glycerol-3-phosphate 3-phosphatidyltransferase